MKLLLFLTTLGFLNLTGNETLTTEERQAAVKQMEESRQTLLSELNGLSDSQVKFKPEEGKWSIAEVAEHISMAETGIAGIIQQTLKTSVDSSRRKEIKVSDQQIRKILTNRNGKVQSPEVLKPTGKFADIQQATGYFINARNKNIEFIKNTQENLRQRYWQHPATGVI
ncbi:MAG: DinB family protein, partial [Gloeobacteraceae cyanobacterium ES-bin-316]|nr:DinB family protein [Ferruginibacter sp.]